MTSGIKVGELARRTGVSVRTLHYYDEIRLLSPSGHTPSRHRLYTTVQLRRLQQIVSLRQLGFSLEKVLELHVARLTDQVERGRVLRDRLERILTHLRSTGEVTVDQFLDTIEATTMNKYYTPQQMEQLAERRVEVGEDRIREVEQEWKDLFEALRVAMEAGTDPASESVQELARKSQSLIEEFTAGDAGITRSLGAMYKAEGPELLENHGMKVAPGVWEYMGKAVRALKSV
jgi:DNA-binding transcriptional MerR regulator